MLWPSAHVGAVVLGWRLLLKVSAMALEPACGAPAIEQAALLRGNVLLLLSSPHSPPFSPRPSLSTAGSPSAATAYYYNVYKADDTPVGTLNQLKADVGTATGSTAPTTPSGSTAYASLTPSDLLTFSTGDLKTAIALVEGFYKVRGVHWVWKRTHAFFNNTLRGA